MKSEDARMPIDGDGEENTGFLKLVGARVKSARQQAQISRRNLSETSGVSQRYLAELENNGRNISIGLLLKIACALGVRLEKLLSPEYSTQISGDLDISRIHNLLSGASAKQRSQILSILNDQTLPSKNHQRIALIGLRGAGKSSLGALTAKRLHIPFIELNDAIKSASNMPVHEVFDLYGVEGYRRLERQSLERIRGQKSRFILAVAGGIVSNAETFTYLLNNFHTIWLKAKPEDHMARVVSQGDKRPMAGHPRAMKDLQKLLKTRQADYARADAIVDTSATSIDQSVVQLVTIINAL